MREEAAGLLRAEGAGRGAGRSRLSAFLSTRGSGLRPQSVCECLRSSPSACPGDRSQGGMPTLSLHTSLHEKDAFTNLSLHSTRETEGLPSKKEA